MNIFKNIINLTDKKIAFLFLFSCQFYFVNAFSVKDSLKNKYDITDPKNPDCACHKYQKLADDEYKKLLGKEIKINSTNINLSSDNNRSVKKIWTRNRKFNFLNIKKRRSQTKRKSKKLNDRMVKCFHF